MSEYDQYDDEEQDDESLGMPALVPARLPAGAPPKPTGSSTYTPKGPTTLSDEELALVRGKIAERYTNPADYDSSVKAAESSARNKTTMSHLAEGLESVASAGAIARGHKVNSAGWESFRQGLSEPAVNARKDAETSRKRDEAMRPSDPGSPESQRARELWGAVYKEAYGGKLPAGFEGLSAADLSKGNKSVDSMLRGVREQDKMGFQDQQAGRKIDATTAANTIKENKTDARAAESRALTGKMHKERIDQKGDIDAKNRAIGIAEIAVKGYMPADPNSFRMQPTEAKKLRDVQAVNLDINAGLNTLEGLYENNDGLDILPTEKRDLAAAVAARLFIRVGTSDVRGALQKAEIDFVSKYMPEGTSEAAVKDNLSSLFQKWNSSGSEGAAAQSMFMNRLRALRAGTNDNFNNLIKTYNLVPNPDDVMEVDDRGFTKELEGGQKSAAKSATPGTPSSIKKTNAAVSAYINKNMEALKQAGIDPSNLAAVKAALKKSNPNFLFED